MQKTNKFADPFQNGTAVMYDGDICTVPGAEFTLKQFIKVLNQQEKVAEESRNRYNDSVRQLQDLELEIFAMRCAGNYAKANMYDFSRFADEDFDLMCRYRSMAFDKLNKLKKQKKSLEYVHANFVKNDFQKTRFECDKLRNILNWIWSELEHTEDLALKKGTNEGWWEWRERMGKEVRITVGDTVLINNIGIRKEF